MYAIRSYYDPRANRVNVPGICDDVNWTWRLPVTLERLLEDAVFFARNGVAVTETLAGT